MRVLALLATGLFLGLSAPALALSAPPNNPSHIPSCTSATFYRAHVLSARELLRTSMPLLANMPLSDMQVFKSLSEHAPFNFQIVRFLAGVKEDAVSCNVEILIHAIK